MSYATLSRRHTEGASKGLFVNSGSFSRDGGTAKGGAITEMGDVRDDVRRGKFEIRPTNKKMTPPSTVKDNLKAFRATEGSTDNSQLMFGVEIVL